MDICVASNNTAVGSDALGVNTTGDHNVAVGKETGAAISTGTGNILLGTNAGASSTNLTTGNFNIVIGYQARTNAAASANMIVMGQQVTGEGNNNFTFGNGSTDSNIAFGATSITAPSDIRLKEDIQDEQIGLNFVNDLRPVTYRWKKAKDVSSELDCYEKNSEERVMNGKYNHGFIAQEVKQLIDKHDLKDGFDMWSEDEADGRQRIGEASLMPLMVKAVQELKAELDAAKERIKTLEE